MIMRDDPERAVVPVPQRALVPFESWSDDVVERCYELWSTLGGRTAEGARLTYAEECEDGEPLPTDRTIRRWAVKHGWAARADGDFRKHHGRELFALQVMTLAAMKTGVRNQLLAGLGAFDDNPGAGLVRLKAAEQTARMIERKVLPLMPAVPEGAGRDWEAMSTAEKEAFMRGEIRARKGKE